MTSYSYDPVGNLTNVAYPLLPALSLEYGAHNRTTKETKTGVITNSYVYKPGGQLETEETLHWPSSKVTLGYTSRLRTSLALQQPVIGNWTQTVVNDSARRLQSLTSPAGTFTYGYVSAAGTTASHWIRNRYHPGRGRAKCA